MRHLFRTAMLVACLCGGMAEAKDPRPFGRVGFTGDVGVPEGAMVGVAVRPIRPLRIGVAGGSNAIGFGVRGSITAKIPMWLGPSLTVEAGAYPPADANGLVSRLTGSEDAAGSARGMLESIGYHWGSVRAGVEFGDRRGSFVLSAGVTRLHSRLQRVDEWTADPSDAVEPLRVTVLGPSAQIGGVVWLGRSRRRR